MRKILLFGATGYIGNNLLRYLNKLNKYSIFIFCRPTSSLKNLEACTYEEFRGDLLDPEALAAAVKNCSGIINLAAETSLLAKHKQRRESINIRFVELLVDAILRQNPQARLVHCSSVGAISLSRKPQILDEKCPFNGVDIHYFLTKKKAEDIIYRGVAKGLNAVIVNPGTVIGGYGMRGVQLDMAVKSASGKLKYYPPGGTCFSFVEDVIRGIHLAYEHGNVGERYILGGHNLLFKEYFENLAGLANKDSPQIQLPGALLPLSGRLLELAGLSPGRDSALLSICYGYYSSEKAIRELGYEITPLDFGLRKIIQQITISKEDRWSP